MVAISKLADPDAALDWNRRALALAETSSDPRAQRWLGSLYNNLGWTCFDKGDYAAALELFQKDERFRRSQGTPEQELIAGYSQARTLRALGELEKALTLLETLLGRYRERGLARTGFVHEEMAECLLALGREGHREHFRRAYELLSRDPWFVEHEEGRLSRLGRLGAVTP
jgi:tetratricopeptide (TPR) repeat protein